MFDDIDKEDRRLVREVLLRRSRLLTEADWQRLIAKGLAKPKGIGPALVLTDRGVAVARGKRQRGSGCIEISSLGND